MFGMKKTSAAPRITSAELQHVAVPLRGGLSTTLQNLYARLAGRSEAPIYNCEGAPLELECAIVREIGDAHFTVAARFGDRVIPLFAIPASDPAIRNLPLEQFGPSQDEIDSRRARDEFARMTQQEAMAQELLARERIGLPSTWLNGSGQQIPRPQRRA